MNILLSGAGFHPYLVRWFREALAANEVDGVIIAADADGRSPARAFADRCIEAPHATDPSYVPWLQSVLTDYGIRLAVSVDDVELSVWARLPATPEWAALVRLSAEAQRLVEDKYAMNLVFAQQGMNVPRTWLGGAVRRIAAEAEEGRAFVVKARFGTASRGPLFTDAAGLKNAVDEATHDVTDRQGRPARVQRDINPCELVIVQERIVGPEYGIDVLCDLNRTYAGVLARRKITMRAGETHRAESVAADDFDEVARRIADAVSPAGAVDVDVMLAAGGPAYVIDVNPRSGGGYPLSHLAGARVPHAYVAWAAGLPVAAEWLAPRPA